MPWRVITVGGRRWHVAMAAEQRDSSPVWSLVLAFRAVGEGQPALWVPYPIESVSKASLFARAERLSDEELTSVLAEQLAAGRQVP